MPLLPPLGRPVHRSRAAATAAAVAAVALAGGTGYAAAAGKPPKVLSTVCVAKSGAVSVPTKHGCGKGAAVERLASPVPGRTGATGPAGPPGPAGVPGAAGNNGLATTVATTFSTDVPNTGLFTDVAHCAPGSVATGGGYDLGGYDPKVTVAISMPDLTGAAQVPTGWLVRVQNLSGVSVHLTIYALCAQPAGA